MANLELSSYHLQLIIDALFLLVDANSSKRIKLLERFRSCTDKLSSQELYAQIDSVSQESQHLIVLVDNFINLLKDM